ncbi:hypothetical protein TNCV_781891 [Trichonephila clavipes]|nr:hypothetical protein TNCV_781891 [Trichonephila clavipes]
MVFVCTLYTPAIVTGHAPYNSSLLRVFTYRADCNVVTPNGNGPDTHTCILQLQIKRSGVADLATSFLTPEESNTVDRKMKERCFELTRERWPTNPPLPKYWTLNM